MVTKIDASAANACFLPLLRMCEQRSVVIVYAGLAKDMEALLHAHKATIGRNVRVFRTLFEALEWTESELLFTVTRGRSGRDAGGWADVSRGGAPNSAHRGSIEDILRNTLELTEPESGMENIRR
ncbi:unnamed protein product [Discosporangium mesarthrocarpum]